MPVRETALPLAAPTAVACGNRGYPVRAAGSPIPGRATPADPAHPTWSPISAEAIRIPERIFTIAKSL